MIFKSVSSPDACTPSSRAGSERRLVISFIYVFFLNTFLTRRHAYFQKKPPTRRGKNADERRDGERVIGEIGARARVSRDARPLKRINKSAGDSSVFRLPARRCRKRRVAVRFIANNIRRGRRHRIINPRAAAVRPAAALCAWLNTPLRRPARRPWPRRCASPSTARSVRRYISRYKQYRGRTPRNDHGKETHDRNLKIRLTCGAYSVAYTVIFVGGVLCT